MSRIILLLLMSLFLNGSVCAQQKSEQHQRAEEASAKNDIPLARYSYIRAYEDYARQGKIQQGVECGVRGAALYYREHYYQEAFDLLRRIDQSIADAGTSKAPSLRYLVTKERLQMYIKLKKSQSAMEQLRILESYATSSGDEKLKNDVLYTKAICYYTFGQNDKGAAVFRVMADRLTRSGEYDKVEDAWKALITSGRQSGNASLVAQAYSSYIAWKDSVSALQHADEVATLRQQITDGENAVAERDSSLATRKGIIVGISTLLIALAVVLAIGAVVLLRYIVLTRRQRKALREARENIALKAHFISNISSQLTPTLEKLDARQPEVRALQEFSEHLQTLSQLETNTDESLELEETPLQPFCEKLINQIRDHVASGVSTATDAPNMSANIHREYVSHILLHLLTNAAELTPADGHIRLEFKKRSAHKHQFIVSNTGSFIAEEQRENVFKPFLEVRDLTRGDGLGLPICRQMAQKMKGNLYIDPEFTRGTRFVLDLYV